MVSVSVYNLGTHIAELKKRTRIFMFGGPLKKKISITKSAKLCALVQWSQIYAKTTQGVRFAYVLRQSPLTRTLSWQGGKALPPPPNIFRETNLKFSYDHENFFGENNLYL